MPRFLLDLSETESDDLIDQISTHRRLGVLFARNPSFTTRSQQGEANSMTGHSGQKTCRRTSAQTMPQERDNPKRERGV